MKTVPRKTKRVSERVFRQELQPPAQANTFGLPPSQELLVLMTAKWTLHFSSSLLVASQYLREQIKPLQAMVGRHFSEHEFRFI